jgi:penicillin-insensitive murein DD-endopeptidase
MVRATILATGGQGLQATRALCLAAAFWSGAVSANPWSQLGGPSDGAAQSVGKYTAGCLVGAQPLEADTPGLITMRPGRNRHYGHPHAVAFVEALAEHLSTLGHGSLLVGDLSQPRGGPTTGQHVSHQTGLDVDIWFEMLPAGTKLTVAQRNARKAPGFVNWREKRLLPNWGAAQEQMLRFAAERDGVERVFVNPVIKRQLCLTENGNRAWLAKLRPWWGHGDHMHVRLRCPPRSSGCVAQAPPPSSPGCGSALGWWFDDEKTSKRKRSKAAKPNLPAACSALLRR